VHDLFQKAKAVTPYPAPLLEKIKAFNDCMTKTHAQFASGPNIAVLKLSAHTKAFLRFNVYSTSEKESYLKKCRADLTELESCAPIDLQPLIDALTETLNEAVPYFASFGWILVIFKSLV